LIATAFEGHAHAAEDGEYLHLTKQSGATETKHIMMKGTKTKTLLNYFTSFKKSVDRRFHTCEPAAFFGRRSNLRPSPRLLRRGSAAPRNGHNTEKVLLLVFVFCSLSIG